jgi:hypothetical protein
MKTKTYNILLFALCFLLSGFYCFATESSTEGASESIAESDFDEENLEETINKIKSINTNDFKKAFSNIKNITIPTEIVEKEDISMKDKMKTDTKSAFSWIGLQLWNIKGYLIVLLALGGTLKYIQIKKERRDLYAENDQDITKNKNT